MEVLLIQNEVYMSFIQRIKDIFTKEKAMKLEKTVDMMLSDNIPDQRLAEYHQAVYRRNKLQKYIKEREADGVHKDEGPMVMLRWKLRVLDDYIYVMKAHCEMCGDFVK